jgi:hypothetical protein
MRTYLSHVPKHKDPAIHQHGWNPLCCVCYQSVLLETAKTEEHGLAIHEQCYFLKLQLQRATTAPTVNIQTVRDSCRAENSALHNLAQGGGR